MINILCFGDSNTHGSNPKNLTRYKKDERWTGILQEKLGSNYYIIEEGLSGRTTIFDDDEMEGRAGINYIYPCLMSHKPIDLLIMMLGTNDTKECFNKSVLDINDGLIEIINKAKSLECSFRNGMPNILIVCPTPILQNVGNSSFNEIMGNGCSEKSFNLHYEFEKTAKKLGCHYINAGDYIKASDIDCVHLELDAHKILADILYQKIRIIF